MQSSGSTNPSDEPGGARAAARRESLAGDRISESLANLAVGVAAAGVFFIAGRGFSSESIALVFALIVLAFADATARRAGSGFARLCDGLGGGRTPERVLGIMRDANVGAFGVVGLTLAILLQHASLVAIADAPRALIAGQILSHAFAALLARSLPPATTMESAAGETTPTGSADPKDSYAAQASSNKTRPLFAVAIALVGLWLTGSPVFALAAAPLLPLFFWLRRVFRRRAGGVTIDLRGAAQQLARCFYLLALAGLRAGPA